MTAETMVPTRLPGLVPFDVAARRSLRGALLWGAVFVLITLVEATQFAREYPTEADRARLVATMGSDVGFKAILGPGHQIDTVAGYVSSHLTGVLSIIGAVWGLFTATRLLRGEEDAGRWELLLAGRTTRRRATAAAMAGLGAALAAMWAVTAAGYLVIGRATDAPFTVGPSLFAATATVAAAAVFLAVGALCGQLAATRRQAVVLAAAAFGTAYLTRAIAYSTTAGWLRWASPLAWVDETHPFIGSRLLPMLLLGGLTAILAAATIALAGRRDLGAGVFAADDTTRLRRPPHGPFSLALRLNRGIALGWIAGLGAGGFLFGLAAKGSADVWSSQSGGLFADLTGARGGTIYLGIIFLFIAFLVALAAAGLTAATREEEAEGYLDHLLARPMTRLRWLASRFAVATAVLIAIGVAAGLSTWAGTAVTQAGLRVADLLTAGFNVVPVGILVLGIGTLVHGLAPRMTTIAVYGLVAWSFVLEIIGTGLGAADWLLNLSILHHISRAPAADVRWGSLAVLTGLGVLAAAVGALAFIRRDLKGA